MVPIISRNVFHEQFPTQKKIAILLGLIGAVLLTTEGNLAIVLEGALLGDILILLAGGVWAFFMIGNKKVVSQESDILPITAVMMILTAVFLFPFSLGLGTTPLLTITWQGWIAILYTGVFCSLAAYFLWSTGLKGLTVTASALILLLEIVWALILAFILLGELFSLVASIGAILLFVSIFSVARDEEKETILVN
jgi:drug/metabolite transporter (DMT)-like permease